MAALWRMYERVLHAHPFKTQVITTGILCGTGDILAQQFVERKGRDHDVKRTVKFSCIGFFFIAPALRTWLLTLDKLVKGTASTQALVKVGLDQTLWAPAFLTSFLSVTTLLDGKGISGVKEKLSTQLVPVLITNYKVWPAVQLINFYFVPLHHRLLVIQTVSLFWNTYLSWVAYKSPAAKVEEVAKAD